MPSSYSHDYLLYPAATDARRLQTQQWDAQPMVESQVHMASGTRWPVDTSINKNGSMMTAKGPLDMGDLIFALANIFHYRVTGDVWEFCEFANRNPGAGWNAPILYERMLMFGQITSAPTYEMLTPILDKLTLEIMGEGKSSQTQVWYGKTLNQIATPTAPVTPLEAKPYVRRNADWVVKLSTGLLSDAAADEATVLKWKVDFPSMRRLIYDLSNDSGDTGWDTFVNKRVEPMIDATFLANTDWIDYYSFADGDQFFMDIGTQDGKVQWTQRVKLVNTPNAFEDDDDAHIITVQFVPFAAALPGLVDDDENTQGFTAASGTIMSNAVIGAATDLTTAIGAFGAIAGYVPNGLERIYYNTPDDEIHIGPASMWREDNQPTTVSFDAGTTEHDLVYVATDDEFVVAGVTAAPFSAGAVTAEFGYDWEPDTFLKVRIDGSGVRAF